MFKELSSLNELHDEVDAISLLENVVHPDDKRVVHLMKDELLNL